MSGTFSIDTAGLLVGGRFIESPNHDDRPAGVEPEVLIIHCISLPPGEYGGSSVTDFFCNRLAGDDHPYFAEICEMRVSSHFYVERTGEITQFVPTVRRAWHAGESHCLGRDAVNDFSVGIELEGLDTEGFETEQYESLWRLSRAIIERHPVIDRERVFGHSDIAPGRKTDPGPGFDWERFRAKL